MDRIYKIVTFVIISVLLITKVSAASCSYEERAKLNNEASNVKADYEIAERELEKGTYAVPDSVLGTEDEEDYVAKVEYMVVSIYNLTENMYVEVTNDFDNEKITYTYANSTDGKVTFDWDMLSEVVTYKIVVKTSSNTGCSDTTLRTITLKLPRYNDYSTYAICSDIPEYYLCQRYVTFDEMEMGEFIDKATEEVKKQEEGKQEEEEKENEKWYQKAWSFVVNHKVAFIVGGIILVVAIAGVVIVIVRRRRRV